MNVSCSSDASSDSFHSRTSTGRISQQSMPIRRKQSAPKPEKVVVTDTGTVEVTGSADASIVKKRCAWVTPNTGSSILCSVSAWTLSQGLMAGGLFGRSNDTSTIPRSLLRCLILVLCVLWIECQGLLVDHILCLLFSQMLCLKFEGEWFLAYWLISYVV